MCKDGRELIILNTCLYNPVVQTFCVLLKLLPHGEVDLIISEGAERFGFKYVTILNNDLSLFEMRRYLTSGKVDIWRWEIKKKWIINF